MFDYILALLSSQIADDNQLRLVFSTLAFVSVLSFLVAINLLISGVNSPFRRRLRRLDSQNVGSTVGNGEKTGGHPFVLLFGHLLPNKKSDRLETYNKLILAGYRKKEQVSLYYAMKILLALALPLIGVVLSQLRPEATPKEVFLIAIALALVGFMLPNYILKKLVTKRQKLIRNGFPDALDLLVVCVESGLALTSAFQRVATELEVSYYELAEEMRIVNDEIRAGISRQEAFRNLVRRTGLDEIKGLISNLEKSMRFGTSIADSLRVYSEEFRDKRMQKAEEAAAKIATKLIFPMVTCLWPGFFIIAMGPAVLMIFAAFDAQ
ncbi:MAG: type II secretion system F family protein [Motiliproteus sp.]